jgi:hypothetical protein
MGGNGQVEGGLQWGAATLSTADAELEAIWSGAPTRTLEHDLDLARALKRLADHLHLRKQVRATHSFVIRACVHPSGHVRRCGSAKQLKGRDVESPTETLVAFVLPFCQERRLCCQPSDAGGTGRVGYCVERWCSMDWRPIICVRWRGYYRRAVSRPTYTASRS